MTDTIRPALTVKQLAVVLGVGPAQVRRMIRDGELPSTSQRRGAGTTYSVPAAALDAWIVARAEQAAAQSLRAQRSAQTPTETPTLIRSVRQSA